MKIPDIINPKSEYRNPKQCSNDQNKKVSNIEKLENSNLFRASNFVLRNFIFIFSIFYLLTGCGKKEVSKKQNGGIPVKVMKVRLADIEKTLDYVGDIKAEDEAIVYPKASGKIIEKVKEEGAPVFKYDVICYIDRDEIGYQFEKATAESPLEGVVGRVYVDIGSNVTLQTPIALVVNMDKVKIDLDIPEKYLPRVSLNQVAKIGVDAYWGKEFSGEVTKISPVLDLSTRTAPIEITIENPEHLLQSGMFAKVKLSVEEHKNVPVILKEAILGNEPNLYVYVARDKKAVIEKIVLGIRQAEYLEVKEGLKDGDLVVVMGQQRLKDGSDIEPQE
ncbi:MAG: efflux RND transporter periplasmic adaptor subunit [Candidatus Omnitrophota bacterium]